MLYAKPVKDIGGGHVINVLYLFDRIGMETGVAQGVHDQLGTEKFIRFTVQPQRERGEQEQCAWDVIRPTQML